MKRILITVLGGLLALASLGAQSPSGRQIMQMAEDSRKTASSATDMTMTLIDSGGSTSVRRLQTLIVDDNGLSKTITVFKEPASVANTRFLTIENPGRADDQWIYLPALRKVRRIASGERSGSFMGSDFSYSDMQSRDMNDYNHNLLREENLNGMRCWVVESVPIPGKGSDDYARMVSWVDQQNHVPVKVEYYGEGTNQPVKVMENTNFQEIDGVWTPMRITMTTVATNHRTVMEINQVKQNIPIGPGYFTTNFLQTGRAQ